METPAAIKASYADYRRVKGRKVLQLIFEVPLEQAPQVHEAFGEPLPDGSSWVGIARIDENAVVEKKGGGKLCQRAGILSNEGAFITYLNVERQSDIKYAGMPVAQVIRDICGVTSRKELDHNPEAGRKFLDLVASYEAWKRI